MTTDSIFPGETFPTSFVLLYCPCAGEDTTCTSPFRNAYDLEVHLKENHNISIFAPNTVYPFIDQYLSEKLPNNLTSGTTLGGADDHEDADLRQRLQHGRLTKMLSLQEHERATTHKAACTCLFCPSRQDSRYDLFTHMFQEHRFNIGLLDNLVMVDDFLRVLREKLSNNTCIYCDKCFANGTLLKKHLKAKKHYKIPPNDHSYDKYYLVNYTQAGKLWTNIPASKDDEESDQGWSDLDVPLECKTQCLFCDKVSADPESCLTHMLVHGFDLREIQSTSKLTFYDSVKLINYLRYQRAVLLACPGCALELSDDFEYMDHMNLSCVAMAVDARHLWNRVQFYIPIFDEDPLLEIIDILEDDGK